MTQPDKLTINPADYEYSQLTDDEIEVQEVKRREDAAVEAEREKKRMAKMREFRFTGGMC